MNFWDFIFHFLVGNINYVVSVALIASLFSFAFSIIQVRRKAKEMRETLLREAAHLPVVSQALILAVSDEARPNWADSVQDRQKISDEPKKHLREILAPPGQINPAGPRIRSEQRRLGALGEAGCSSAR